MITETKVRKKGTLRAEDAAVIAQNAGKFQSECYLVKGNKKVNAKSIMGVISLSLKCNDTVMILTVGQDEESAAKSLKELF